jgi:glycosyltransferase involved in cell wall biosynthesis
VRVAVTCDRHFLRTPDGAVWSTSSDSYRFWQRYLAVFDEVLVISRVEDVSAAQTAWRLVTGPRVSIEALPDYLGPLGYLRASPGMWRQLRSAVRREDAVILRIPSHVATSVEAILGMRQQPYGVEVVGDMAAALAFGSVDHILRPWLRIAAVHTVRRQCRNAVASAYVTANMLQQHYPPSQQAFSTYYSSIELSDGCIAAGPRVADGRCIKIITVGSMAMKYKRFDVLIEAVRQCLVEGLDLRLALIGDGYYRSFYEDMARALGDRVEFLGELPGSDAVSRQLLKADLFVLCSANEGLPRVIIEAMASGLPCIGTTVGGTPELLPPEQMVSPGDVGALAARIREVTTDPERMRAMSVRNIEVARQYVDSELAKRRCAMYHYLREYTERRLQNSRRAV